MKIGIVGGVGKTTTSTLLGRVLVGRGRRVLAVDTDSNPNLGLSLGLGPEATETLAPIPRSIVVGHVSADRRGEPLDRAIAREGWDAAESLVDSLEPDAVPVA